MTNTAKLRDAIRDSGLKIEFIAEQIGMTRFGLYKKLETGSEFKPSQVATLCELLGLDEVTRKEIFLI